MAPSNNNNKKPLKDLAKENPTQLGDPVSLKAETSKTQPTEQDRPNKAGEPVRERDVSAEEGERNPSQLGDPVSLKAETAESEPTEEDRGALGTGKSGKPKM